MVADCSRRRGEEGRSEKLSQRRKAGQKCDLRWFGGVERKSQRRLEEYTSFLSGAPIRFIAH